MINLTQKEKYLFFSLDSMLAIKRNNDSWIKKDCIFPLKAVDYDGYKFYVPNNSDEYIKYEYKNYDEFPSDYGVTTRDYIYDLYVTVEFYIIDSFEIYHFLPLYRLLREKGVYAIFVLEDEEVEMHQKWVDYKMQSRYWMIKKLNILSIIMKKQILFLQLKV